MASPNNNSSDSRRSGNWSPRRRRMLAGWWPRYPEKAVLLTEEQLRKIFVGHDKNGDGSLNKDELVAAFRQLGSRNPGWRAERAIYDNDLDLDDALNEHEIEHLIHYALRCKFTL